MPRDSNVNKAALVLSGSGAYGAYETGVMKALIHGQCPSTKGTALDPSIFVGSSAGGFNAAMMATPGDSGASVDRLEQVWVYEIADRGGSRGNGIYRLRGDPPIDSPAVRNPIETVRRAASDASYFSGQIPIRASQFLKASGSLSNRALGVLDVSSLICCEPFEEMLGRVLDPAAIRKSEKTLRVVATNWRTGGLKVFTNADMTDQDAGAAIMGTASVPGIFPPVPLGSEHYVDGGLAMSAPLGFALDAGATELHVVYLDPERVPIAERPPDNTVDIFDRVYSTLLAAKISQDIETARSINKGLDTLERARDGVTLDGTEESSILRVAGEIYERIRQHRRYSLLTIHRYCPAKGRVGALAILNLTQGAIRDLIGQGYEDALGHDCERNNCVIP